VQAVHAEGVHGVSGGVDDGGGHGSESIRRRWSAGGGIAGLQGVDAGSNRLS
jgi:hypothetical protein